MNMNDDKCPTCGLLLESCPYDGDCGEVQSIYRAQQREKLRDLCWDMDEED